jgi:trimethylamine:corrinoid methyltransferase-like protein
MAKRLIRGVEARDEPIALDLMRRLGHRADYLAQTHTLKWFAEELYIPSAVIDRGSLEGWRRKGAKTTWERAQDRVRELWATYTPSPISDELRAELRAIATTAARRFGMDELPPLPQN